MGEGLAIFSFRGNSVFLGACLFAINYISLLIFIWVRLIIYCVAPIGNKRLVQWLDTIKADAAEVFLMGDVFDFWFEYATVIPKGYIRLIGKLAELADLGIKLYFFKGNHDMWMFDYFVEELGATIITNELVIERNGKKFFLHHGDGLGPGDGFYKFLKAFFRSKLCQWLFARLHPNSWRGDSQLLVVHSSRAANQKKEVFKPGEQEWLVKFCNNALAKYFL
jgi:UDP-2,3-diacylglucosamine hydrolase